MATGVVVALSETFLQVLAHSAIQVGLEAVGAVSAVLEEADLGEEEPVVPGKSTLYKPSSTKRPAVLNQIMC